MTDPINVYQLGADEVAAELRQHDVRPFTEDDFVGGEKTLEAMSQADTLLKWNREMLDCLLSDHGGKITEPDRFRAEFLQSIKQVTFTQDFELEISDVELEEQFRRNDRPSRKEGGRHRF